MRRILLPSSAALAACASLPQEAAMRSADRRIHDSGAARPGKHRPADPGAAGRVARVEQAARAPIPAPVSAAANPAPPPLTTLAAQGRRTLSTAFVMLGPGGYLTIELHNGRVLVLRDVILRRRDYCGIPMTGGAKRYCGGYAEVRAARSDIAPIAPGPVPAASNPVGLKRESPKPR